MDRAAASGNAVIRCCWLPAVGAKQCVVPSFIGPPASGRPPNVLPRLPIPYQWAHASLQSQPLASFTAYQLYNLP